MAMVQLKDKKYTITYNISDDFLTFYINDGSSYISKEVKPGYYLSRSEGTNKICGFSVFSFMSKQSGLRLPFGIRYLDLKKLIKENIN